MNIERICFKNYQPPGVFSEGFFVKKQLTKTAGAYSRRYEVVKKLHFYMKT